MLDGKVGNAMVWACMDESLKERNGQYLESTGPGKLSRAATDEEAPKELWKVGSPTPLLGSAGRLAGCIGGWFGMTKADCFRWRCADDMRVLRCRSVGCCVRAMYNSSNALLQQQPS